MQDGTVCCLAHSFANYIVPRSSDILGAAGMEPLDRKEGAEWNTQLILYPPGVSFTNTTQFPSLLIVGGQINNWYYKIPMASCAACTYKLLN